MSLLGRLFHVEPRPEPRLFVCPICGQLQVPDVVDESKPVPPAENRLCGKCLHGAGLSRRRFLFLGAATGITLAAYPFMPELGTLEYRGAWKPVLQFDAILKDIYEPLVVEQLNRPSILASVLFTGPEIAATRDRPGSFQFAITRELAGIAKSIELEEEQRLVRSGRRPLFGGRRRGGVQCP